MRRFLVTILEIIICFLLQTVIFSNLSIGGIVPNILIVFTVSHAYMHGKKQGMYVGVICGLLYDLMNGGLFGLYGLVYLTIGYVNGMAYKIYYKDDYAMPVILVAISDFVAGFSVYVFEFLLSGKLNVMFYIKYIIMPEVMYTALVSIVLYKFFNYLNKKMDRWVKKGV